MSPVDLLQWTAIAFLAWLLWRRGAGAPVAASQRPPERPDAAELAELEARLAGLLHDLRQTLERDLAALEELRRAVSQAAPVADDAAAPRELPAPPQADRAALPRPRDWTPEQLEVLQLLAAGHDCDSVARRTRRSPHEVRLLARLAAGVQKLA